MRKIAILLIALLVISVGMLSGCNEKSTDGLEKSNEQESAPNITFKTDDVDSYLQVVNSDPGNLAWTNINITIDHSSLGYGALTMGSGGTAYATTTSGAPAAWGDITGGQKIYIACAGACNLTLRWIPTNTLLGEYSFT